MSAIVKIIFNLQGGTIRIRTTIMIIIIIINNNNDDDDDDNNFVNFQVRQEWFFADCRNRMINK